MEYRRDIYNKLSPLAAICFTSFMLVACASWIGSVDRGNGALQDMDTEDSVNHRFGHIHMGYEDDTFVLFGGYGPNRPIIMIVKTMPPNRRNQASISKGIPTSQKAHDSVAAEIGRHSPLRRNG